MKVFLVYLVIDSPLDKFIYSYGLGYISALLKKNNNSVVYFIIKNQDDVLNLYNKIKEEKPEIIGFSSTTSQFYYLKDIARRIKEISSAFLICGGIHPTLKPDCIFEIPQLNAIVRGEGEYPMVEFTNALKQGMDYYGIKNFWFRNNDGSIIKNAIRPLINIDELPPPDKDSIDYQRIIDESNGGDSFIFSRGCLFECAYCSNQALAQLYNKNYYRFSNPEKAITEIKLDERKFKFSYIFFQDDIISLNKQWFFDFFSLYKKCIKYPFGCNVRPGLLDEEMVAFLKSAGCKFAGIGLEHGNENFRKTVLKRDTTDKQIIDTFNLFKKFGLDYYVQVIVGLPYENKKLFLDTVRLCRKIGISSQDISIFTPYPGTELGELCKKNNWLPQTDSFQERVTAVISYPGFDKKQIQLCHDIFPLLLRFKFLPLYVSLGLIMRIYETAKKFRSGIRKITFIKAHNRSTSFS